MPLDSTFKSTPESTKHIRHGQPYATIDLSPMPESSQSTLSSQELRIWPLVWCDGHFMLLTEKNCLLSLVSKNIFGWKMRTSAYLANKSGRKFVLFSSPWISGDKKPNKLSWLHREGFCVHRCIKINNLSEWACFSFVNISCNVL